MKLDFVPEKQVNINQGASLIKSSGRRRGGTRTKEGPGQMRDQDSRGETRSEEGLGQRRDQGRGGNRA